MKFRAWIATLFASMCFLTACDSTTAPPDINSLQPSPQQQHQSKLNAALQS